eukprot:7735168-Lingulodinium_polyedra.AAC.1
MGGGAMPRLPVLRRFQQGVSGPWGPGHPSELRVRPSTGSEPRHVRQHPPLWLMAPSVSRCTRYSCSA